MTKHWYCDRCGEFDGPKSGDDCDVCWDAEVHSQVEYMVSAGEVERLREALHDIATRPTVERNPDGDDQAAWTMQLIAREALAGVVKEETG